MFWALEQRRKRRAKWKEEEAAGAFVEIYAEAYTQTAVEVLVDAPAATYAEIRAKAYADGFAKGVLKAMQNLEKRMESMDLPSSYRVEFRQAVKTYMTNLAREKGVPVEKLFPSENGILEARVAGCVDGYTEGRTEVRKALEVWLAQP